MKTYDAIVIGAGIAGLSTARELAKQKLKVLVVERENPGGTASRAAAGILDPYTEAEEETPLLRLGMESLKFYSSFVGEIEGETGADVEFEKLGILYLALGEEDEKFLKRRLEWQKRHGIPAEFWDLKKIREKEPVASPKTRSGVFYPDLPKLNARKLTDALFKAAQSAGAQIQTSMRNAQIWAERGEIYGIRISHTQIESPVVVYAAGSWASLDKILGLPLQALPVRGQILVLQSTPALYPKRMLHTVRQAYILPWPGRRLLLGSTLEKGESENRVTPEGKKDILNRAGEMIEGLEKLPIESSWSGLRPLVEGGMPQIGPAGIRGLFAALGYYRSGILIGPLVGKLLAEGILSGKFSDLLKPFHPHSSN